nr:hypothetical protein [Abalone asfa-like virus]
MTKYIAFDTPNKVSQLPQIIKDCETRNISVKIVSFPFEDSESYSYFHDKVYLKEKDPETHFEKTKQNISDGKKYLLTLDKQFDLVIIEKYVLSLMFDVIDGLKQQDPGFQQRIDYIIDQLDFVPPRPDLIIMFDPVNVVNILTFDEIKTLKYFKDFVNTITPLLKGHHSFIHECYFFPVYTKKNEVHNADDQNGVKQYIIENKLATINRWVGIEIYGTGSYMTPK